MDERITLSRVHVGILIACGAITLALFAAGTYFIENRTRATFSSITADNQRAATEVMANYRHHLNGMSGFLDASQQVTNEDWRVFVTSVGNETYMPGLVGTGYLEPVPTSDIPAFLDGVRQDGIDDFDIHPETGKDQKYIIRFVEPIEDNPGIRGLDLGYDDVRLGTILAARDQGQALVSPPLIMALGRTDAIGFAVVWPRYRVGMPVTTVAERQAALQGWVFARLDPTRVFSKLTANQGDLFSLSIRDTAVAGADGLLFASPILADPANIGRFRITETIPLMGRTWEMTWQSTPNFDRAFRRYGNWGVFWVGLLMTYLLYMMFQKSAKQENLVRRQVVEKTRELMAREDQNRSIIENAVFAILLLDADNRILAANAAAAELFNFPVKDLLDTPLVSLVDDFGDSGDSQRTNARGFTSDGRVLYLDMQHNDWTTAAGERRQSLLVRDITDETASVVAVQDNERRWNLALQGAEIGVFDIDLTRGVSVVSETWLALMGVDQNDPDLDTQRIFLSRIHPADLPILKKADRDCLVGKTPRSVSEFRVKFPDNVWRWMRSDAVVVERDADGKALRMVGTQSDVTELRRAQDALRHSEDRFRLVLTNAPVGMAVVDKDGRFQETNTAISELSGFSPEELDGLPLARLFFPEDVELVLAEIAGLIGSTEMNYHGEHRLRTKSGEPRWGLVKVTCAFDSNEGAEIYIVQIHDITQSREMERLKNEFVATVSHELRTPLTSIKGAIGLLQGTVADELPKAGQRLLDIAAINADRLSILVNDILDIEKLTAGKLDFDLSDVRADEVAANAVLQIKPYAERLDVSVEADRFGVGPWIHVDPRRLHQVLANLLSNACKFSPKGGTVQVGISTTDGMARFTVTDNGSGIPESFKKQIFEPFSQVDGSDTRQKGGTGLGLSISKQMVERMGGTIGFDSAPGQPTVFWFTCPLGQPPVGTDEKSDPAPTDRSAKSAKPAEAKETKPSDAFIQPHLGH